MMFTMLAQCVVPTIIMIIGNGFNITTGVLVEDANGQMVLPELPEGVGLFEAVSQGDPIDGGNWVHLISLIVLGQAMAWTFVQMGTVWLEPVLSAGILLLSPVTSVIIAWPLFGEIPSWLQWLGVVIILGCVMFQNGMFDPLLGKKKKEEPVVAETVNEAAGPAH